MNKEIIIKSTLKKELIKSIVYSFIFSCGFCYIFLMAINFGVKIGQQNENFQGFPNSILLCLIPLFTIIFMMVHLGEMVTKGYFDKGGNKK